jgi:hypothetical protein
VGSAGAMKLKTLLRDDPLLQEEIKRCKSPDALCEFAQKLSLKLTKADLLRMEAKTTLTLSDEELETWFEKPYWARVLNSMEVIEAE